jgi:hypothetical protein
LEFQPGEEFDGNEGHTFVVPIKSLPTDGDELAEKILDFCSNPKPSRAITNQFRHHGAPVVLESITKLEKSGELSPNIGAKGRRRLVAKNTATM